VFLRDLSWDPYSSMWLLMTYAMQLPVPQGCALRPLLFSVFINDICNAVAHSKYLAFADDIKIYRTVKPLRTAIYFSLTLPLYKVGALLTVRNLISVKVKLYPSPGKPITKFVNPL
jgi:hypothetical protein